LTDSSSIAGHKASSDSYQPNATRPLRNNPLQKLQQAILKLRRCPHSVGATSQLYVDHSHCLVLAPATLAVLPSTRAIPDRDVFYVAHPIRSIQAM
jgi:hypothetical protein